MKRVFLIGCLGLATACATMPPATPEQREITFVEETSLKKKDAYDASLNWLAKNLGDSNFAIKVKDADAGTIITQIATECPELKVDALDFNKHTALYNLEVGTKDNKMRFAFEAVSIRTYNGVSGDYLGERAFTAREIGSAKICAERTKAAILASTAKKSATNW